MIYFSDEMVASPLKIAARLENGGKLEIRDI
jgi:hypothetical protein